MQRLSSFSRAWMHVQYRGPSLLPCPFYHKSQSSEASNHKARTKQPSFHSSLTLLLHRLLRQNHLTALSWTDDAIVYEQYQYIYTSFGSTDFLDANKAVVSACRRHLRTTYRGLPQWCSLSNALRQTTKKIIDVTAMGKEFKYSYYLHFFLYTRPVYQNYNLQRATNTNRGKIDGVTNQGH